MLDESDAIRLWQQLICGKNLSFQTLAKAELLVEELPPESPLRLRFTAEINELRDLNQSSRPKRRR